MTSEETVKSVVSDVGLQLKYISIEEIKTGENIRKEYADIDGLADSIRKNGLIHPITVYCVSGEGYVVKTGHRRLKAYRRLFVEEPKRFRAIPCLVSTPYNIAAVQLAENVQRADLSAAELYEALRVLRDRGTSLKDIAAMMGRKTGSVKNFFCAVNEIEKNPKLKHFLEGHAGVTIQDVIETKSVENEETRIGMLRRRHDGTLTRTELRKQAKKIDQDEKAIADRRFSMRLVLSPLKIGIEEMPAEMIVAGVFEKKANQLIRYLQADACPVKIVVDREAGK